MASPLHVCATVIKLARRRVINCIQVAFPKFTPNQVPQTRLRTRVRAGQGRAAVRAKQHSEWFGERELSLTALASHSKLLSFVYFLFWALGLKDSLWDLIDFFRLPGRQPFLRKTSFCYPGQVGSSPRPPLGGVPVIADRGGKPSKPSKRPTCGPIAVQEGLTNKHK